MRVFVFLLVLANLLFFAWTRDYLGMSRDPDAFRVGEQLRADQIRIVSNDVPPPETVRKDKDQPAKPAETPAEVCVVLSDVPAAEAESFESLLAEKLPAFKAARTVLPGSSSYWVHIPPLKSKREAESKVAELKKLGVNELFIMQESGANNLAISLGVFSSEAAAGSALEALKEKGVRSAKVLERPGKTALAQVEIRGPEAQAEEMRQAVNETLPQIKQGSCGIRNAAQ